MNTSAAHLRFAALLVSVALGLIACNKPPEAAAVPSPAASAAAANVPDIDVTEHVKTALLQSDALKGFDITVETIKGDVRLNGKLDTQAQIDEAIRITHAADGVHAIHDELTIRK
jgi:osmotically-inducible protein OsmY